MPLALIQALSQSVQHCRVAKDSLEGKALLRRDILACRGNKHSGDVIHSFFQVLKVRTTFQSFLKLILVLDLDFENIIEILYFCRQFEVLLAKACQFNFLLVVLDRDNVELAFGFVQVALHLIELHTFLISFLFFLDLNFQLDYSSLQLVSLLGELRDLNLPRIVFLPQRCHCVLSAVCMMRVPSCPTVFFRATLRTESGHFGVFISCLVK